MKSEKVAPERFTPSLFHAMCATLRGSGPLKPWRESTSGLPPISASGSEPCRGCPSESVGWWNI